MFKPILFNLFVFIILPVQIYAQKISGKVIDSENTIELENVTITDSSNQLITTTNAKGIFQINSFDLI